MHPPLCRYMYRKFKNKNNHLNIIKKIDTPQYTHPPPLCRHMRKFENKNTHLNISKNN